MQHSNSADPISMLDLQATDAGLHEEIMAAIAGLCRSGRFIGGPVCTEFEQRMAELCQVDHAIGCASGSDALLLALMAIDLQPGEEVIVPSFTFFATASAVWRLGATPVFVDIDPGTYCLDPNKIEDNINEYTRAIVPVHLFGQCCDMPAIGDLAAAHGLHVIEDAAQSIGASWDERMAGGIGDMGCFSFYPTKNLGAYGDGGLLTTSNGDLAKRLRLLANHGMSPRYYHAEVGINSRLDSIQAAVLNVKLGRLNDWTRARGENADRYLSLIAQAGLEDAIELPAADPRGRHVWNQYTIRIKNGLRDQVRQRLTESHIGTEIYYPVPLHRQVCFETLDVDPDSLPETEAAAAEVLSLPIHPGLTPAQQDRIVETLARAVADCRQIKRKSA
jgi:dTDP-4-amino-4,6-dideoxygalactose transaminase